MEEARWYHQMNLLDIATYAIIPFQYSVEGSPWTEQVRLQPYFKHEVLLDILCKFHDSRESSEPLHYLPPLRISLLNMRRYLFLPLHQLRERGTDWADADQSQWPLEWEF